MDGGKDLEGSQFQHALNLALKKNGQNHDIQGYGLAQTRRDADVIAWHVIEKNFRLFLGALPHQTLAQTEFLGKIRTGTVGETGEKL